MQFDDRLATILDLSPTGSRDRAVRWRQLVDLVARAGPDARSPILDRAIAEIRAGRDDIAFDARAAAARSIAGRPLAPALLETFAADRLDVAAPLLTVGAPSEALRRAASPEVRRFLDAMHPPAGMTEPVKPALPTLPPAPSARSVPDSIPLTAEPEIAPETATAPQAPPSLEPEPAPSRPSAEPVPSISEVVERIERLRQVRDAFASSAPPSSSPPASPPTATDKPATAPPTPPQAQSQATAPLPRHDPSPSPDDSPALFRWECGPGGAIGWVEGAPRGALVGRSIARGEEQEGVDREVERAFARRAPFRDATLTLPEASTVAGEWLISGVPAFAPADGRFVGYRGIARRADALAPVSAALGQPPLDPAELRELVHEIKTPLNAIIGFAEIIDGQYLGPAQAGYRERAAEIVAQAQVLLAAIDDLDFAARLRGRAGREGQAIPFADLITPFLQRIQARAGKIGITLAIDAPAGDARCELEAELAERLLDRFANAVLASAAPGETLRLAVRYDSRGCSVLMSRPRILEGVTDAQLFQSAGGEGVDYSLRMVGGLAQIVGGSLSTDGGNLILKIPAAH